LKNQGVIKMELNINAIINDYDGNPITDAGLPLTTRSLLRMYAGSYVPEPGPKAGEQSIIANAIGLKIHASNGEVELTDEEYDMLKKIIKTPRHVAMVYAQIHAAVHSIKK